MDLEKALVALHDLNERLPTAILSRESDLSPPLPGKVISVIGPRRAGKTWRLFQAKRAMTSGHGVYVNLEDDRIHPRSIGELSDLLDGWFAQYPGEREGATIFLDEVQTVPDWERLVRRLQDTGHQVFIAGSSSRLLYHEIATQMRGRSLPVIQLPFSFRERLLHQGMAPDRYPSPGVRDSVLAVLAEHLRFGGFPEIVLATSDEARLRLLREYLDTILIRDILAREEVHNLLALSRLVTAHVASCGTLMSINRIWSSSRGQPDAADKKTLYRYTTLIEKAYLSILLPRWSRSERTRERSQPKVHMIDNGLMEVVRPMGGRDLGRRLENTIAIELFGQMTRDPRMRLSHWRGDHGKEVDFIIEASNAVQKLIQVCYDPSEKRTLNRELLSLRTAAEETGCDDLLIITWDTARTHLYKGNTVRLEPAWRWLLGLSEPGSGEAENKDSKV